MNQQLNPTADKTKHSITHSNRRLQYSDRWQMLMENSQSACDDKVRYARAKQQSEKKFAELEQQAIDQWFGKQPDKS